MTFGLAQRLRYVPGMMRQVFVRSAVFVSLWLAAAGHAAPATPTVPWWTPYGSTRIVKRGDAGAQHQINIRGRRLIVSKTANGAFAYTDEQGAEFVSAPREGASIVTPFGVTKTLQTSDGVREVLKTRKCRYWERKPARIKLVSVVNGRIYYTKVGTLKTPYGETEAAIVGDRLVQRLALKGKRYEVSKAPGGKLRYTDESQHASEAVIEDERGLVTPHGVAKQMKIGGEKAWVVVDADPSSYETPPSRRYRRVEVTQRGFKYHDIDPPTTPYGLATIVRTEAGFAFQVLINGKRYRVEDHAGAQHFVDSEGKPFVDEWQNVVQTPRAVPIAATRLYNPRLARLPAGGIVRIGGHPHMSQAAYDDLRDAMIETMQKLDPRTHYFIGLGSDPHPIIAFLSNLGGRQLAINFPASGKGYRHLPPSVLAPYSRRLIPPEVLNGSRSIVLLDQTGSGTTLAQIAPVFETYLRSIGSPATVKRLAYSPQRQPHGTLRIDTGRYAEVGKFLYPPYEDVTSQYPRHVLGVDAPRDLKERTQYVRFRGAMKKRMQRDAELDAFLAKRLNEEPETETALAAE